LGGGGWLRTGANGIGKEQPSNETEALTPTRRSSEPEA
jgi:hypothetical protein